MKKADCRGGRSAFCMYIHSYVFQVLQAAQQETAVYVPVSCTTLVSVRGGRYLSGLVNVQQVVRFWLSEAYLYAGFFQAVN
jgi:hypothetical protein